MPTNKTYHSKLSYKQQIADLLTDLEQVFSSSLSIMPKDNDYHTLAFNLKENNNNKFELTLYSSIELMMNNYKTISISIKSKSMENRQIVISTFFEKDSETISKTIFIGLSGDKNCQKIYLVDIEPRFSNLSLLKLNTKLFTPFGRANVKSNENVKVSFTMINMDYFLIEEENETIQNACDIEPCHFNYSMFMGSTYLTCERAIYYQGNWYVKGELKKWKERMRTNHDKIPMSNSNKWRKVISYGYDTPTRVTDWIVANENRR